jgi:alkylated DNA repair dioxygenase AlkB
MKQGKLFEGPSNLPAGMIYQPEFLTPDEETQLITKIHELPLHEAQYKQFTAKRRIASFGASYNFSTNRLSPADPIPPFLEPLRERVGEWARVPASQFTHGLVTEYQTGTQLGWHRDVPEFEVVVGISLGGPCRMRMRPYPPKRGRNSEALTVNLAPRSVYVLRDEARWGWQHCIPPTKNVRYSITFRTRRGTDF